MVYPRFHIAHYLMYSTR